ncbi:ParB/RepB/Spo0J family partition protein [Brotaphodocola sp.]|uniref:ParB/RepB/Spo0J family partition protein n=1 Tax=Brotaphodocola sp. TaxID=3073577 RepID=UPI003D7DE9D4
MRRSRKGLGRGLGAFFGEEVVDEVSGKSADTLEGQKELFVKVTEIEPNPDQPRKYFDEAQLNELAESIRQYGVLQPLLVQKKRDHYEIVAGERRWRAARIAEVEKIPVIVREFSAQEAMEIALIENLQREDLDPIEEAKAYERLMLEFRMTQGEIAKRVSKSRTVITNSVRLLYLNPEVQKMVSEKRITSGHARAILSLQDQDQQLELAKIVERDHLNVREVERAVKTFGKEKKEETKAPETVQEKVAEQMAENPDQKPLNVREDEQIAMVYQDLEERMKEILGTQVIISRKDNNRGKIEIPYYSQSELERIIELIESIR